jgi:excisionase family DNA binding protein
MHLLTVREAAEKLHCSPGTVYSLCGRGVLAHHRIGSERGAIRISEEQLTEFLSASTRERKLPRYCNPRVALPRLKHVRLG